MSDNPPMPTINLTKIEVDLAKAQNRVTVRGYDMILLTKDGDRPMRIIVKD